MRGFYGVDSVKFEQLFIRLEDTGGLNETDRFGELAGIIHVGVGIHLCISMHSSGIACNFFIICP